ncbi:Putative signal peptide protein [hydrothermal vent metagenome]|uniref:Putative signal peptide protein n=1 Tax=hydrothermal vent metagenome TaxID=652676 RepID=A0A1W1E1P7_9ZZZZ
MKKITTLTLASLTLLSSNFIAMEVNAGSDEKCYGVVKAGKNDCATKVSSCAGTAKTDAQTDAFIAMPKGLCEKLVNGSLTSS